MCTLCIGITLKYQRWLTKIVNNILKNKIGKYENHYYARYNGGKIAEVWRLRAKDVLSLIMPKIKKQYAKKQKGFGQDPRIGVSIPMRDIITHGERIK